MSSLAVGAYTAIWKSVSVSGQTLTFNILSPLSTVQNNGSIAEITSESLTVTLIPQVVSTSGNVTGFINLISTAGVVTGSFSGTYVCPVRTLRITRVRANGRRRDEVEQLFLPEQDTRARTCHYSPDAKPR